ncbi:MAG: sigma-70 family RNA polymerase sigma factor [Deltaproteobacteria bacterium]|nr:sigma-70 family RNA polymerase sigma factor [Deltaproteobacteria bacterium]
MCEASPSNPELDALYVRGAASWPALALSAERFVAYVAARLDEGQDPNKLVAEDLYLAAACVLGVEGAASALIARYAQPLERYAHKLGGTPATREDLLQDVWARLLTPGPDGSAPKLAQYRGRGPLEAWLRVTLLRRGIDAAGRPGAESLDFEEVAYRQAAAHDPELSVLRRRHGEEVAAIFREAIEATPREERTLLRMHYVDGATMNELAVVFRTSRSGIHRRLEGARDALMARITALVRARLSLDESQHASMLGLFQSELRSHLGRLLHKDR